ncbi:sigma-70 family RNA polymerase sigma factor [Nocardioides sp. Kera G14]|uniref:sigma-70 family RNA polymerase sigma factor n=1 Tax=Nocardioides sp. Kera G14 TaxID=2884264 RepID=UPI001D119CAF|nr:FliA/WhiG family RNA polymerase sigma factor [Nocardioides sp. Kera G14]UDY24003.1 FliA/WhiG family RNA polymerase sigma factor [Nocardioides sp. Kera G14]
MLPRHDDAPQSPASAPIEIADYLPMVGHLVRETLARVPAHVDRDDLTSAGMMALVQAAQSYDESRGVPFDRYAARRIRGAILDELRSVDWASRRVRRAARDIEATRSQLATSLGRQATNDEVASTLGIGVDEILSNDDDVQRAQVLSLQGSAMTTIEDILPSREAGPEQQVEHQETLTLLTHAIAELPERLRAVVEGYFLAERPMAEIAAELGVTDSRISQMRAEALVLLQGALNHALEERAAARSAAQGVAERRRTAYYDAVSARFLRESRPNLVAVSTAS